MLSYFANLFAVIYLFVFDFCVEMEVLVHMLYHNFLESVKLLVEICSRNSRQGFSVRD